MTDNKDRAIEINKRIGSAIKQLRLIRGMTQEHLATILGVSFQQLQKYERGKNRVSAARLVLIAEAFNIPVQTFFEYECDSKPDENDRLLLEVAKYLRQIKNPLHLAAIHTLIKSMATESAGMTKKEEKNLLAE